MNHSLLDLKVRMMKGCIKKWDEYIKVATRAEFSGHLTEIS